MSAKIYGNTYVENSEKSMLKLSADGSYTYYTDKNNLTRNYYEGSYHLYNGETAINYISTHLSEYNLSEKDQLNIFERNAKYTKENYYCLILYGERIYNDKNTLPREPKRTPYFGFFFEDTNTLTLVDMDTEQKHDFIKQTQNIGDKK